MKKTIAILVSLLLFEKASGQDLGLDTVGAGPVLIRPSMERICSYVDRGAGFNEDTVSLNTRLIINYSIPLISIMFL